MSHQFTGSSYVLPENISGENLQLEREESHHLLHVLRRRQGDVFFATDGQGMTYECEFVGVDADLVRGRILRSAADRGELGFDVVLCLALLKRDKFEWVVEKGTELGVSRFIPVLTSHTIARAESCRPQRSRRIAVAAMKQSCRSRLPVVGVPVAFAQMLDAVQECDVRLLAHEGTDFDKSLFAMGDSLRGKRSIAVCIGPEGGVSAPEVEAANDHGFTEVTLGRRRLRSETAAIAAVSTIVGLCEPG